MKENMIESRDGLQLELKGITMTFGTQEVLKGIDLSDGISTLAVIGPSGGGKSTLLRIIGGLLSPTAGEGFVGGERIRDHADYRKRLGFVFQQNGLLKHKSALENICLPLVKVHGFSREEAGEKAMALLRRFGLEQEADKRPNALSGGQSQRIAIARAIAPNPALVLLDEPTSALDPEYTIEVLNMVRELEQEGMRFIIVTHEMGFARTACEKTLFLGEGRILEYGVSRDIFSSPRTESLKRFLEKLLEWD